MKYHSPGRWSNAACTHTLEGETPLQAAQRALQMELGLSVDHLQYLGYFIYKTNVGDDLIEHELDHVFVGQIDESMSIPFTPEEVDSIQWMSGSKVKEQLTNEPEVYSYWFPYLLRYIADPQSGIDFRKE
jgi:isopentenyl-diphosphate delta-isomerase